MATADLGIRFILTDMASTGFAAVTARMAAASGAIDKLGVSASKSTSTMKALNLIMDASAISFGLFAGAIGYSLASANDIQTAMNNVVVAVSGAQDAYSQMMNYAINVAGKGKYSISEVADAFAVLGEHGMTAADIMNNDVGTAVVNMAEAMNSNATDAATLLSSAMQMYNINADQAAQTSDILTNAFYNGEPSVQLLLQALQQVGPVASNMGVSLQDTVTLLDMLGQAGLTGSKGGTALRYMLQNLLAPTAKAQKELSDLGLIVLNSTNPAIQQMVAQVDALDKNPPAFDGTISSLQRVYTAAQKVGAVASDKTFMEWATSVGAVSDKFYNAAGNFSGVANMLQKLFDSMKGQSDLQIAQEVSDLLGVRASQGMLTLIHDYNNGKITFQEMFTKIQQQGTAAADAKVQMSSLGNTVKELGTNIKDFFGVIGMAKSGPLVQMLQGVANGFLHLINVMQKNPKIAEFVSNLLIGGAALSGLTFALSGGALGFLKFKKAWGVVGDGKGLADGFANIGKAASGFFGKLSSIGPAAAKGAGNALESVGISLYHLIDGIAARGGIINSLGDLFMHVKLNGALLGAGLKNTVGPALSMLWNDPGAALSKGMDLLQGGFMGVGKAAIGLIPELVEVAVAALPIIIAVLLVAGAVATVVLLFTKFKKQGQEIVDILKSAMGPAFDNLKKTVGGVLTDIGKTWKQVQPSLTTAMNGLVNGFRSAAPVFTLVARILSGVLGGAFIVIGSIIKGFIAVLPSIINVFTGIFNVIGGVAHLVMAIFTGQWGSIPGIVKGIFGSIFSIVGNLFGAVLGLIGNLIGGILGFFGHLFDTLVGHSIVPDLVKAIIKWFLNLVTQAPGMIWNLVVTLLEHFTQLQLQALALFVKLVGNLLGKLGELRDSAITKARDLVSAIGTELGKLPGQMLDLGKNIIDGLINGIKNNIGHAVDAVKNLGGSVLNGVKSVFGIASPSKVMHEMGVYLSQGLVNGIQSVNVAGAANAHYSGIGVGNIRGGVTGSSGSNTTINLVVDDKVLSSVVMNDLTKQLRNNGGSRALK